MGNRIKGRTKRKSIKAAISSHVGSKRKLSRFGKNQKKDHRGLEATYIGRSKCITMLQINLKDFRRLCILKGIYPREPNKFPNNKKGQSYYHIKDIRSIAHEPILEKFREFKAFMKKVRKASGRNEIDEANRKNSLLPKYTLHHIVKERYPRFIDALNDIDDCLTLTYLYATLPCSSPSSLSSDNANHNLPSSTVIGKAKVLAAAWGSYCATTSSITKQFVSVKGIYMEAMIHGCVIRWIIPHAFTQYIPDDVDFRIMNTFFELYQVLLDFILYKLYNDIGIRYPLLRNGGSTNNNMIQTTNGTLATGTTSAILGMHLKALSSALEQSSSGGAISSVISQAVVQQKQHDSKNDSEMNGIESTEEATANSDKKIKDKIRTVTDALNLVSNDNEKADGRRKERDDDDDDDDDANVDIAGPLRAALDKVQEDEARASLPGNNNNGTASSVALSSQQHDTEDAIQRKRLFQGYTFFLSREVPRGYLELICLSYGAKNVGWEHGTDSPIRISDPSITHHIVDRPTLPLMYQTTLPKSREYVQPQYVLDCANFMFILPITRYTVGATLPPHLSPWVDDEEEGYKPAYAEEIEKLKRGEVMDDVDDEVMEDDSKNIVDNVMQKTKQIKMKKNNEEEDDEEEEEDNDDKDDIVDETSDKDNEMDGNEEDDDEEEEDDDEENDEDERKKRHERKQKKDEEETHRLAKSMMNRKASHLYERMQHGIAQRKAKIDKLHQRRKEIDDSNNKQKIVVSGKAANRDIIKGKEKLKENNKTPLKQKVERLKKERQTIETKYDNSGGSMKKRK